MECWFSNGFWCRRTRDFFFVKEESSKRIVPLTGIALRRNEDNTRGEGKNRQYDNDAPTMTVLSNELSVKRIPQRRYRMGVMALGKSVPAKGILNSNNNAVQVLYQVCVLGFLVRWIVSKIQSRPTWSSHFLRYSSRQVALHLLLCSQAINELYSVPSI